MALAQLVGIVRFFALDGVQLVCFFFEIPDFSTRIVEPNLQVLLLNLTSA